MPAAGATLGDLDHESQAFGLATPLGINSTTGVAGLTLGGGFGWLTRKLGLTVDNLRSAQLVTADAELVRASEDEHTDLFWGLPGGGGNFGVVTSFEFELHPLGPDVLAGLLAYPAEGARERFMRYRDHVTNAPDELACWMVIRSAPPLPFIPAELHGREVQLFAFMWAGQPEGGTPALDALRHSLGAPAGEHVVPHPYVAWQKAFDPLLTPGARNYWKSHYFGQLSDEAIETVCEYGARLPTAMTEIFIGQLGGHANRLPADATAYPHRDAEYAMNVHARWDNPEADARAVGWAREFHAAMAPFATGGVYVNFVPEGDHVPDAAFGPNYDRLAELKSRWDPQNLFRMNQNVAPRSTP